MNRVLPSRVARQSTAGPPDLNGVGTPESAWAAAGIPARLPLGDRAALRPRGARIVLLAPHPDDEVLGAGGLVATLAADGADVRIVSVTDGEASHPERSAVLPAIRAAERAEALSRLGLPRAAVIRLRHPDGRVDADRLATELGALVRPGDVLLAPWSHDGHPDHDACGRASGRAAARCGAALWSYLVWTWHWAAPDCPTDVPWHRALRFPLADDVFRAKRAAVRAFVSQLDDEPVILPPHVLVRVLRADEVLLAPDPDSGSMLR